eukprot:8924631-Pyramimonas_sp.AAC.1
MANSTAIKHHAYHRPIPDNLAAGSVAFLVPTCPPKPGDLDQTAKPDMRFPTIVPGRAALLRITDVTKQCTHIYLNVYNHELSVADRAAIKTA